MSKGQQDHKGIKVFYGGLIDNDIFSNSDDVFLFKKGERIVAAMYMLTNLFPDSEPLKWTIRQESRNLIKDIIEITSNKTIDTYSSIKEVQLKVTEISSYVSLSNAIGLMSNMNFTILNQELISFTNQIKEISKRHKKVNEDIGGDFFEVERPREFIKDIKKTKRHQNVFNKEDKSQEFKIKSNQSTQNVLNTKTDKQIKVNKGLSNNDRINSIMNILKDKGKVSIKDIAQEIPEYSEKTIQRDLMNLIDKGVVEKEGERRWSQYYLKN